MLAAGGAWQNRPRWPGLTATSSFTVGIETLAPPVLATDLPLWRCFEHHLLEQFALWHRAVKSSVLEKAGKGRLSVSSREFARGSRELASVEVAVQLAFASMLCASLRVLMRLLGFTRERSCIQYMCGVYSGYAGTTGPSRILVWIM